jgi:hypothetical protein
MKSPPPKKLSRAKNYYERSQNENGEHERAEGWGLVVPTSRELRIVISDFWKTKLKVPVFGCIVVFVIEVFRRFV